MVEQHQILLIVKCALVFFIAIAPFAEYSRMTWIDSMFSKVTFMILIVGLCFLDFQLALLTTIAFFIMLINVNSYMVVTKNMQSQKQAPPQRKSNVSKTKIGSACANTSKSSIDITFQQPLIETNEDCSNISTTSQYDNIVQQTIIEDNVSCQNTSKNDINQHMMNMFIDEKIKPYDAYIGMLTSEDNLARAQGML